MLLAWRAAGALLMRVGRKMIEMTGERPFTMADVAAALQFLKEKNPPEVVERIGLVGLTRRAAEMRADGARRVDPDEDPEEEEPLRGSIEAQRRAAR